VLTSVGVALATAFAAAVGYGHAVVAGTLLAGVGMVLTVVQGTFVIPLVAQLRLGWSRRSTCSARFSAWRES